MAQRVSFSSNATLVALSEPPSVMEIAPPLLPLILPRRSVSPRSTSLQPWPTLKKRRALPASSTVALTPAPSTVSVLPAFLE